jgi:hypothetical protein
VRGNTAGRQTFYERALEAGTRLSSQACELFKPGSIQQRNVPVLLLHNASKIPLLEDLIDALPGCPNELGQGFPWKTEFDLETLRPLRESSAGSYKRRLRPALSGEPKPSNGVLATEARVTVARCRFFRNRNSAASLPSRRPRGLGEIAN